MIYSHMLINKRWYSIVIPLLLIILTIAVYYNSLFYGFVFDDNSNILKNFALRNKTFFDLFFANSRWISQWLNSVYFSWVGHQPFLYRLGNLIIHTSNGLLLYNIIMLLAKQKTPNSTINTTLIAFITAGLFLLHPVQTQTVTYIVQGQLEGLATFSILVMLFLFIGYATTTNTFRKKIIATLLVLTALCAAGTKEIVICAPALLLLIDWFFLARGNTSEIKKRTPFYIIFSIILLGALCVVLKADYFFKLLGMQVVRFNTVGNPLTGSTADTITPFGFLISQFSVILHYMRILIAPYSLSADYDVRLVGSFFDYKSIIPFLVLIGLFVFIGRRLYRNKTDLVSFAFLWFFISLLPRASIIPSSELIADYKIYLPSIGIFFLIALLIAHCFVSAQQKEESTFNFATSGSFGLLCLSALFAHNQNSVWSSHSAFWENVLSIAPQKARAYNNYAVVLIEQKNYDRAIQHLTKATEIDQHYPDAWANLSVAYGHKGQIDKAISALEQAIKINPLHAESYNNLATFLVIQGKFDAAELAALKAIELRPHYGKAFYTLGKIYYLQKKIDQACDFYKKSCMEADFQSDASFAAWGMTSMILKKYDDAIKAYSQALAINPNDQELMVHCAHARLYNKDFDHAEQLFKKLYLRNSTNPTIILGLAETYALTNRFASAITLYKQLEPMAQQFPIILLRIAGCYFKDRDIDNAVAYTQKFLSHNPPQDVAHKARGILTALQKKDFTAPALAWWN